jgi:FkbM family methyltransferase
MNAESSGSLLIQRGRDLLSVCGAFRNWPTYLVHYFGLTSKRYMEIALRRHGLRVRSVGRGWEFHSLYLLMFEEDEYRVRQYGLPARSVIIDIGAHIGWFTLAAASAVSEARTFSFEPMPENYTLLAENLRLNSLTNRCQAFQMAVTDIAGEVTVGVRDQHPLGGVSTTGTILASAGGAPSSAITATRVRATTLDEILADNGIERCALLKIDCEGAEHQILASAAPETLARIDRISVEVDSIDESTGMASLARLLSSRGYRCEAGGRWGNILYAVRT